MNRLEEEYGAEIDFYRLNVGDPELEQVQLAFDMRGHPTVAVLDDKGVVLARFFGLQTAEQMRPSLEQALVSAE